MNFDQFFRSTFAGAGLSAALLMAAPAQAEVITFDSAPQYTCGAQVTSGLVFTSDFCLGVWPNNPVSTNGTPGLIYGYGPMEVVQFDGGVFHLTSMLAGISWYSSQTTATVDYTFYGSGGTTSAGSFVIGQGFQNYTFDVDIVRATFTGLSDGYVAIDNVVGEFIPAPVPEPTSSALMALGIALVVSGRTVRQLRSRAGSRRHAETVERAVVAHV